MELKPMAFLKALEAEAKELVTGRAHRSLPDHAEQEREALAVVKKVYVLWLVASLRIKGRQPVWQKALQIHQACPSLIRQLLLALNTVTQLYHRHSVLTLITQTHKTLSSIKQVHQIMKQATLVPRSVAKIMQSLKIQPTCEGVLPARRGVPSSQSHLAAAEVVTIAQDLFQNRKQPDTEQLSEAWRKLNRCASFYGLKAGQIMFLVSSVLHHKKSLTLKQTELLVGQFKKSDGHFYSSESLLSILSASDKNKGTKMFIRERLSELLTKQAHIHSQRSAALQILAYMSTRIEKTDFLLTVFNGLLPSTRIIQEVVAKRLKTHQAILSTESEPSNQPNYVNIVWSQFQNSTKLDFMTELLRLNDFKRFTMCLNVLGSYLNYIYHPGIILAACQMLEWVIQPLYDSISQSISATITSFPQGSFKQVSKVSKDLKDALVQLIGTVKGYVFSKASTMIKVCRLFTHIVTRPRQIVQEGKEDSEWIDFILKVVKLYLLPSLGFHRECSALVNQLNKLINCFKLEAQLEMFWQVVKIQQLRIFHIAHISQEKQAQCRQMINEWLQCGHQAVIVQLRKELNCNPIPCVGQIIDLVVRGRLEEQQAQAITSLVSSCHQLTCKIALFYIFLHLTELNSELTNEDGNMTELYYTLSLFLITLVHKSQEPEEIIRLLFSFFFYQSNKGSEEQKLNHFQYFHGEVTLLLRVMDSVLPLGYHIVEKCSKRNELVGGPYLRMCVYDLHEKYMNSSRAREAMAWVLFHKQSDEDEESPSTVELHQTVLIKLLKVLLAKRSEIETSSMHNISVSSDILDRINTLMYHLIEFSHITVPPHLVIHFFGLNHLKELIHNHGFPIDIALHLTRIVVTGQIKCQKNDYFTSPDRFMATKIVSQELAALSSEKIKRIEDIFEQRNSSPILQTFFSQNIVSLFWLLDLEFMFKPSQQYANMKQEIRRSADMASPERRSMLMKYEDLLVKQNQLLFRIQWKKLSKQERFVGVDLSIPDRYLTSEKATLAFTDVFIDQCIFARCMLSAKDAYYCWSFLYRMIVSSGLQVSTSISIIFQVVSKAVSYLPFATPRENSQCLALLAAGALSMMTSGRSDHRQFQEKLRKVKLVLPGQHVYFNDLDRLTKQLYEEEQGIIARLVNNIGQICAARSSLNFLVGSELLPLFSEHLAVLRSLIETIRCRYGRELNYDRILARAQEYLVEREAKTRPLLPAVRKLLVRKERQEPDSLTESVSEPSSEFNLFKIYPDSQTTNETMSDSPINQLNLFA